MNSEISPAKRALPWLYWMLFILAVSNITALTSYGIAEYLARFVATSIAFGGAVYGIAYAGYAFKARRH
ncbi:hypothetical protein [Thiocystis violacea]|uniref:hypothetical protein n=1 Tax=Thiocystis violacea TaxID=13725 RepID=UPI0019065BE9|nr:hypothetical protein [Thiocystis violacea]MBK1720337.1 hypothetical protein [Thiocystis violacea]